MTDYYDMKCITAEYDNNIITVLPAVTVEAYSNCAREYVTV